MCPSPWVHYQIRRPARLCLPVPLNGILSVLFPFPEYAKPARTGTGAKGSGTVPGLSHGGKADQCFAKSLSGNVYHNQHTGKCGSRCLYRLTVRVKSIQGDQTLPVCLEVYPLNLPSTRHLKVTEWYSTGDFAHFHGIQEKYSDAWFAMLRKYADNMVAHRQNVFQVPMDAIEIKQSKDGQLLFDFTRFDQIAQVFWDTKKMDYLETGELARFGSRCLVQYGH